MSDATIAAIAASVSAIAALVSVIGLIVSVWLQWHSGRPHAELVGAMHTLMASHGGIRETRFGVEVRNTGTIPIVVTSVGVIDSHGQLGVFPHPRTLLNEAVLPAKLGPGESVSVTADLEGIREFYAERGIKAVYANTASGRRYEGKNTAVLKRK